MSLFARLTSLAVLISWSLFTASATAPGQTSTIRSQEGARHRIVSSQSLPKLNGEHLKVTIVEVRYGPGQSSPPHSHPCPVVVYVLEGAARTKVKGKPETTYEAGESFYEAPNGIHEVSANPSQTKPAKFIAYFVCDRQVRLSVAPPTSNAGGQP